MCSRFEWRSLSVRGCVCVRACVCVHHCRDITVPTADWSPFAPHQPLTSNASNRSTYLCCEVFVRTVLLCLPENMTIRPDRVGKKLLCLFRCFCFFQFLPTAYEVDVGLCKAVYLPERKRKIIIIIIIIATTYIWRNVDATLVREIQKRTQLNKVQSNFFSSKR